MLFLVLLRVVGIPPNADAQQHEAGLESTVKVNLLELGGQITDMRFGGCFSLHGCDVPQFGGGLGVSLNVVKHLSIDSVVNVSSGTQTGGSYFKNGSVSGGRITEGLIGPRGELRGRHYGLFLDAKSGSVSWSQVEKGIVLATSSNGAAEEVVKYGRGTFFSTEIGGGVEYLPTERLHIRLDTGDVLIRYDDANTVYCNSCIKWTNNFQSTVGIYVGVGRMKDWSSASIERANSHTFWSEYTVGALGVSLFGQAADAITTQRALAHGGVEGDPLAGPLVKYGWSGQIGFAALNNAAEVTLMYGLHRLGQHRLERVVPLAVGAVGGYFAYENVQGRSEEPSK